MTQNIPSPKEVFGSLPLREAPHLSQNLGSHIMHVARVVIADPNNRGAVLVAQRDKTGEWHLPGGKVDPTQTCNEAGEAEILQETGLHISLRTLPGAIYDMRILDENGKPEHQGKLRVSTIFSTSVFDGMPEPLDETRAVAWQSPQALAELGNVRQDTYSALSISGHLSSR